MASKRRKKQKSNRPAITAVLTFESRRQKSAWKRIIRKDPCCYCGAPPSKNPVENTVEHLIPRSQLTEECNWDILAGACFSCNNGRGDMPFLKYIVKLRDEGKFLNYVD